MRVRSGLHGTAIVRPVEEGLALFGATGEVARRTVVFDLRGVAGHGLPASDLAGVFDWESASHVVPAVPLEPTARVVRLVEPAFVAPDGKWLAGVDSEEVEAAIVVGR